ncbi:MAG: adenosine kinase [Myxococcales bacterium]|nr:adenosine kinase [Myxococcales bacterium]
MSDLNVTGIGNAIVDVLTQTDDAFISEHNLNRGSMTLIDAHDAERLFASMPAAKKAVSGGSAANTLAGLASLGGRGAFIGKVANDALGEAFRGDIRALGTRFDTEPLKNGAPTARCLIFVTPDAQRTMNTYLGACVELDPSDVDEETIKASQVTYLEGYLWDPPKAKEAFLKASAIAHSMNRKVSLSLSDPFCVHRHRESFQALIRGHIDILFANEAEANALFETDDIAQAAAELTKHCSLVAITRGDKGSIILTGDQQYEVPASPIRQLVDTTGAGDLYAAGFLYGYCNGKSPAEAAEIASISASEIISHFGARPENELKTLVPRHLHP